jgi:uncharacterized surface protein with fasciclin (FAS1) repeats
LKFHVVPGDAIVATAAKKANGGSLTTALEGKVLKVKVKRGTISLVDYNKKSPDSRVQVKSADINLGNKQVAHAIHAVLLPTA